MKYLRQIVWHILPTLVVFLVIIGVELVVGSFFALILILFGPSENGSIWYLIAAILLVLSNALVPSVSLFLIALVLDRLTKNRPVWLKIALPSPFILVAPFLVYLYFQAPVPEDGSPWWLTLIKLATGLLAASAVAFAPYWYILQIQRFAVWLLKKAVRATTRSREPSNQ